MDPNMNKLLKWSIENTSPSSSPTTTSTTTSPTTHPPPLPPSALHSLFNQPSDADLMRACMDSILTPSTPLEQKLIALDNLEQLIETIDNANNLQSLGLWTPLVSLLGDGEGEVRRLAAWCVGTAVQNNGGAQERLLVLGAIPTLVKLAVEDRDEGVRRKAIYALSSEVRNYQPGVDAAVKALPERMRWEGGVDASDMSAVDSFMDKLRQSQKSGES